MHEQVKSGFILPRVAIYLCNHKQVFMPLTCETSLVQRDFQNIYTIASIQARPLKDSIFSKCYFDLIKT